MKIDLKLEGRRMRESESLRKSLRQAVQQHADMPPSEEERANLQGFAEVRSREVRYMGPEGSA